MNLTINNNRINNKLKLMFKLNQVYLDQIHPCKKRLKTRKENLKQLFHHKILSIKIKILFNRHQSDLINLIQSPRRSCQKQMHTSPCFQVLKFPKELTALSFNNRSYHSQFRKVQSLNKIISIAFNRIVQTREFNGYIREFLGKSKRI